MATEVITKHKSLSGISLHGKRSFDRLLLLEKISDLGSISRAAREIGISYKTAWLALSTMDRVSEHKLVECSSGGVGGGGARLTSHGRIFLENARQAKNLVENFLQGLGDGNQELRRLLHHIQQLIPIEMKTSARNQLTGIITAIKHGVVNCEVTLDIGNNHLITAIVTQTSAEEMALAVGREACALIKAPWVLVSTDENLITSARNCLRGVVSHCIRGAINSEVAITLENGKSIYAIVTNESCESLDLKVGSKASAHIKASHVILAVVA